MYNIEDFEPYILQKYLGDKVVLIWSKAQGYQFVTTVQRIKSMMGGLDFKIIAIEKNK